jgi:hypothetical protein
MERLARAPEAALHFVGDEQRARAPARRRDRIGCRLRDRTHAALALDRLDDDRPPSTT